MNPNHPPPPFAVTTPQCQYNPDVLDVPRSPSLEALEMDAFGFFVAGLPPFPAEMGTELDALVAAILQAPAPAPPLTRVNSEDSTPVPRKRGRPPKSKPTAPSTPSSTPVASADPVRSFTLFLDLLPPSKKVKTHQRKTKVIQDPATRIGPETNAHVQCLDFVSTAWRLTTPKNAPSFPLKDENGFQFLLTRAFLKANTVIIVEMGVAKVMPLNVQVSAASGSGLVASVDEDQLSSDEEEKNTIHKRAKLDDNLDVIVAQLTAKYPPGLCRLHLKLACFYHAPMKLHFELTLIRLKVWANAIRNDDNDPLQITLETIPITSWHFHSDQAIKKVMPEDHPQQYNPALGPYGVYPHYPMPPYPSAMHIPPQGWSHPYPPGAPFPTTPVRRANPDRDDDPIPSSSPGGPFITLADFCEECNFGDNI
ncbi:hypothetical protein JAAARDRAFT_193181 [Jaapia argillacea MUCL 33604]|uniref:Uncharacterized protein n=1 Tax=Jaapia argillacea MUCL 33604 TaxID=933084 RepID=A0A067PV90_9AGAM|nr:hypothetical protein JAAARDRAFT_193181 [Jaapia argillacea MUCL 33604]